MAIPGIPEIPQIPTDNLYKFVSLSGVLMLLVGFAVPAFVRYRAMEVELALLAQYESRAARHMQAFNQFSNAIDLMGRANLQELERRQAEATTDLARERKPCSTRKPPRPSRKPSSAPSKLAGVTPPNDCHTGCACTGRLQARRSDGRFCEGGA